MSCLTILNETQNVASRTTLARSSSVPAAARTLTACPTAGETRAATESASTTATRSYPRIASEMCIV